MYPVKSSLFKLKMSLYLKLKEIEKYREKLKDDYLFFYPSSKESEDDFIIRNETYSRLWNEADQLARIVDKMI
jgi:hypothetical protein